MKLTQVLHRAREVLGLKDVEDSSLEAELLMRQVLGLSRVELYQDLNRELGPGEEAAFERLVSRRLSGEPVAYITGRREFFGLDFYVDARVLIPRPETELLVEQALEFDRERPIATVADIGTGSGAIAVSLALNLPRAKIFATDVSALALEVARFNCQKHGVLDRVCLLEGDLLSPLPEPVDLIIANLPYVSQEEVSRRGLASFEPELALAGGCDGLGKIRELCHKLGDRLNLGGSLLLEVGIGQSRAVASLLHSLFPLAKVEITPDLSGIDRVISLTLGLTLVCPNAKLSC
jgi:release factor glutamine methyltransferase